MNHPRSVLWLVPAGLVLLSYNTWMLLGPVNGHLAILNGYLSELAASDQPNNLFFRAGDMITSIIVAVFGVAWLRRLWPGGRPSGRWWLLSAAALLVFAVSTFIDSFFAMDCSPTLSETCRQAEEAGTLSVPHYAHTGTSVGAQVGIVTSVVAAAIGRGASAPTGPRAGRLWVLALAVLESAALVLMLIMVVAGVPGIGYPQGMMVLVASLWFATVGAGLAGYLPLEEGHDGRSG